LKNDKAALGAALSFSYSYNDLI